MRILAALLAILPLAASAQSYTTFPNLRTGNMDFTATIRANGGACSSGQAIVSGSGSVSCVAVIPSSEKGANSGVATLDSGGKVPTAQLPFSGLTYDGSWNANTNSPTLADGSGTSGHFYITSVAGTQNLGSGSLTFAVGDWALYNGTIWQKVPSSAAVSSVFGRTGAVSATAGDYTATQVTNTPAGGISATTAQAAINELDTEKQPLDADLTSWAALTRASGFDTFTQTPSSANLRGLLTDETGTGLAYFQGGALGTPSSGTLTNAIGLPWSTGLTGVPTTAAGFGITGGAKLDAYAGGDTPSAFTLGIVDSTDAATWRAALGAGTSSFSGSAADLTGTLADARLSSNVPLKNAANVFSATQSINFSGSGTRLSMSDGTVVLDGYISSITSGYLGTSSSHPLNLMTAGTARQVISSDGNVTFNAPSSGVTLAMTAASGAEAFKITAGGASGTGQSFYDSSAVARGIIGIGTYMGGAATNNDFVVRAQNDLHLLAGGSSSRVVVGSSGNVTINAPSSGIPLTLTAPSDGSTLLSLSAAAGRSPRLTFAQSGQKSWINYQDPSSNPLAWYDGTANRMTLDTGLQLGSPTGGDPGAGGLNVAGVLQKNGVNACLSDGTNCPGGIVGRAAGIADAGAGGGCSFDSGYNTVGVSTCSGSSVGVLNVTFSPSFPAKPICTANHFGSLTGEMIVVDSVATTGVTFHQYDHTGTAINGKIMFNCM